MPSLDTYECAECGDEFKALSDANAAREGYCSPACETSGKNLR
jgi:DNA-directed RNA polymerase subunit RPC12/RpoP